MKTTPHEDAIAVALGTGLSHCGLHDEAALVYRAVAGVLASVRQIERGLSRGNRLFAIGHHARMSVDLAPGAGPQLIRAAISCLEKALQLLRADAASEITIFGCQMTLAGALEVDGRLEDAARALRSVIGQPVAEHNPAPHMIVFARSRLASLSFELKDYQTAAAASQAALKAADVLLTIDPEEYMRSLEIAIRSLATISQPRAAVPWMQQMCSEQQRSAFDAPGLDRCAGQLALSLTDLASAHRTAGRFSDAKECLDDLDAVYRSAVGLDSALRRKYSLIAASHAAQLANMADCAEEALAVLSRVDFRDDSLDVQTRVNALYLKTSILEDLQRPGEARAAVRSLVCAVQALAITDKEEAIFLFDKATKVLQSGHPDCALALYRRCFKALVALGGLLDDSDFTCVKAVHNLRYKGQPQYALELAQEVLSHLESLGEVGKIVELMVSCWHHTIAECLSALGRHDEALHARRRHLAMLEEAAERNGLDPLARMAFAHDAVGQALAALGRHDEALAAHLHALSLHSGATHEQRRQAAKESAQDGCPTAQCRLHTASAALALGQLDRALALQQLALEEQRAALGAQHPEVGAVLSVIAATLRLQGREDEAAAADADAMAVFQANLDSLPQETGDL